MAISITTIVYAAGQVTITGTGFKPAAIDPVVMENGVPVIPDSANNTVIVLTPLQTGTVTYVILNSAGENDSGDVEIPGGANAIYLNEIGDPVTLLDPFGRTLTERFEEIARKDRTANGRLRSDIIAKKKKFTLAYDTITGVSLAVFEAFYAADAELELTIDRTPAAADVYTVIMSPYEKTRWILLDNGLWTGVQFEFEEV